MRRKFTACLLTVALTWMLLARPPLVLAQDETSQEVSYIYGCELDEFGNFTFRIVAAIVTTTAGPITAADYLEIDASGAVISGSHLWHYLDLGRTLSTTASLEEQSDAECAACISNEVDKCRKVANDKIDAMLGAAVGAATLCFLNYIANLPAALLCVATAYGIAALQMRQANTEMRYCADDAPLKCSQIVGRNCQYKRF